MDDRPLDQADLLLLAGIGNLRANTVLEHGLSSQVAKGFKPSLGASSQERETFIKAKYLHHQFVGHPTGEMMSLAEVIMYKKALLILL